MSISRRISIAPMMGYTDRHYRYFMGLISKQTLLYTEMVHAHQILHGNHNGHRDRSLYFYPQQNPIALQLGGAHPKELAEACKVAQEYGYAEFNLNVGCPSERVQKGSFGACLMREPELVAECIVAMSAATSVPVTVKTRIGVDHDDSFEHLSDFINTVSEAGCESFTIHARKAWLKGLSPKQNRTIPSLNYQRVYFLKEKFPNLEIIINGGIKNSDEIEAHLKFIDGVMIGREAYANPYLFSELEQRFLSGSNISKSRFQIFSEYLPYVTSELKAGTPINLLIRPILGLFHGVSGVKGWRGYLSSTLNNKTMNQAGNGIKILEDSLKYFSLGNVSV